ncbi:MAG: PadR family transcriptional regulator [Promethearchaeota archaeon]
MVEDIADKFGKAMKKGFISTLTLLVLEKEPMHGRQIKKAIEERSFGVWDPIADSTIYTILKNLREKNLIEPIKQEEDEKVIIYEITEAGKKTLDIMIKKEQEIRESIRSIITSTFGIKDEFPDIQKDFFRHGPPFNRIGSETDDINVLRFQRSFVKKRIEILNTKLQNIEQKISKLENQNKK